MVDRQKTEDQLQEDLNVNTSAGSFSDTNFGWSRGLASENKTLGGLGHLLPCPAGGQVAIDHDGVLGLVCCDTLKRSRPAITTFKSVFAV